MKKLFVNKIFIFSALVLIIGFVSILAEPGCKKSTSPKYEQPIVSDYFDTIVFPGRDYSDVTFKHREHSDRSGGSCIKCHNCVSSADNENWNCRSCHKMQDPESRCGVNDSYHGCTYVQCDHCHNVLGANTEPGKQPHNCNYCHTEGQLNPPTLNPALHIVNDNKVRLTYSNTIDQISAELEINYTISGTLGLTGYPSEALRQNNKEVLLTIGDLSGINPGETIIVTVTGVKDLNGFEISGPNVATYTENELPEALNVGITGNLTVGSTLTGSYTYYDAENDAESGTSLKWYRCDNASGANPILLDLEAYNVIGSAGATQVYGIYTYYGTNITSKHSGYYSSGSYENYPMPVYRKAGTDYYIGYRGCDTKWVLLKLPGGPSGGGLSAGPGTEYIYCNDTDSYTVPGTGWRLSNSHPSPEPTPTVILFIPTTYTLVGADAGKYIKFEVTPAAATGNSPGVPQSAIVGPVQ